MGAAISGNLIDTSRQSPPPRASNSGVMQTQTADSREFAALGAAPKALSAGSDFETLVLSQQAFVERLARRLLGWESDVADVVQGVFLAALQHWPQFRREAQVSTWLASITLNACRTHRRRSWLRIRWRSQAGVEAEETGPDADADESRRERNQAVRTAVRSLAPRYREVIVLRYLEGFAIDEIATILGRTRAAIDGQLSRGRAMLQDSLKLWMED